MGGFAVHVLLARRYFDGPCDRARYRHAYQHVGAWSWARRRESAAHGVILAPARTASCCCFRPAGEVRWGVLGDGSTVVMGRVCWRADAAFVNCACDDLHLQGSARRWESAAYRVCGMQAFCCALRRTRLAIRCAALVTSKLCCSLHVLVSAPVGRRAEASSRAMASGERDGKVAAVVRIEAEGDVVGDWAEAGKRGPRREMTGAAM